MQSYLARPAGLRRTRFPTGAVSRRFRRTFYPHISLQEWNNWRWQLQNALHTAQDLSRILSLTDDECRAIGRAHGGLPVSITPYYASLIAAADPGDPVRRTVIPTTAELARSAGEAADPLCEESQSPVPGLIHRYPDRVLFMATEYCSNYCRYCTRSRLVGKEKRTHYSCRQWKKSIEYIAAHPAIRDVIVSGGDPLTLPDESLEWLLMELRSIPHVEVIRIGTKTPAVLPMRITASLTRMLRKYHPLFMSLHFTHPAELTPETEAACARLADAGCPMGSQTVLLKGINDDPQTMRSLMTGLMRLRVRPYYLYQCDPIFGSAHFRVPVSRGLEIIRSLRGHISGYAVPQYVIDAPGGGGKVPLQPEYLLRHTNDEVVLRNYNDNIYSYPDTVR